MQVGVLVLSLSVIGTQPIALTEGLVIGTVGAYGRTSLHTDAIEHQIVQGTWNPPSAGESVTLANGTTKQWSVVKANSQGVFEGPLLRGGYLCISVQRDKAETCFLNASGHGVAYINGEVRSGDPYATGLYRFPIQLNAGKNTLLFQVGRGQLKVSFSRIDKPYGLELNDVTLPDIIENRPDSLLGAVIVSNATSDWSNGLSIRASLMDSAGPYKPVETPVGSIPPLGLKKSPFRFRVPAMRMSQSAAVSLELIHDGKVIDSINLNPRIRNKFDSHVVTFESKIDGSIQYYAVQPSSNPQANQALFLSLHGASVEARGQAEAYSPKTWGHVVCPTNRRPYGFDWEDWGRLDAIEVLDHATKSLLTDRSRTYLTGHSMGGHGTWQIGVQFPDRFAAIGPSAGWSSFYSYGGKPRLGNDPREAVISRAESASDTNKLLQNLNGVGVYVLHGDADDNVPVSEARAMTKLLSEFHRDWNSFEQKGASHWWDASEEPGADCVDWAPMFEFFSRRAIPPPDAIRRVQFSTAAPAVSASRDWVTVEQQVTPFELSEVTATLDPISRRIECITKNVARIKLNVASFQSIGKWRVTLDGQAITDLEPSHILPGQLWFQKSEKWVSANQTSPAVKTPERSGPFKNVFDNQVLLVVGTKGSPVENQWAMSKARYDSETFLVRGNGRLECIRDIEYDATKHSNRNAVLYGNSETNSAWKVLLPFPQIEVNRKLVRVGSKDFQGDHCVLAVFPNARSKATSVGIVAGTTLKGMRLSERIPYFVSGVAFPDFFVASPETLKTGVNGVQCLGFFDNNWKLDDSLTAAAKL